jgi:hypothetical protein
MRFPGTTNIRNLTWCCSDAAAPSNLFYLPIAIMRASGLEGLLSAAGRRMSADLEEQLLSHPGELGTDREEVIRAFLRSYLPKRFEVSTGFVFDSNGGLSGQMDIIIADTLVCPRFETAGGKRIYPCECVVAVGQVRSSLTTKAKLQEALGNLRSAKALDRSAQGRAIDHHHHEVIDHIQNHLHQIFAFLFITGRALSAETIRTELLEHHVSRYEPHLWTNVIVALNQFIITFCCDDGVCPNPMHARGVAVKDHSNREDILMRFYVLLGRAIEVTRVSSLPYWEYLSRFHRWDAEVWYSSADDPPPFLHSLPGA